MTKWHRPLRGAQKVRQQGRETVGAEFQTRPLAGDAHAHTNQLPIMAIIQNHAHHSSNIPSQLGST